MNIPTHSKGYTLDWVLVRSTDQLVSSPVDVFPNALSDYHTVSFNINTCFNRKIQQKRSSRDFRGLDMDCFQSDIAHEYKEAVSYSIEGDVEGLLQQYNQRTSAVLDKHAPIVVRNIKTRVSHPWYNKSIRELGRVRRAL